MKKINQKLIWTSISIIGIGLILFAVGYAMGGRPGVYVNKEGIFSTNSGQVKYEMKKKKISSVENIDIQLDCEADIQLLPSQDNLFYLEYHINTGTAPSIKNDGHTLSVTQNPSSFLSFGFYLGGDSASNLTLYVPEKTVLNRVQISNSAGDIEFNSVSGKELHLAAEYGDVTLRSSSFSEQADIELESGDFTANAFSSKNFSVTNEYGDILLDKSDLETSKIELSSGDLEISSSILQTLDCSNEYGDVSIRLPGKFSAYGFSLQTEYGDIQIPKEASEEGILTTDSMSSAYSSPSPNGHSMISIFCESGDIKITPEK